ncbi:MAG TPA: hypothetical protein VMB21_20600, partial [Candidatus Limnocylindria bacterium]|nr:hypothetical protein [Candidatus Limnocylindria bacterium]
MDAYDKPLPSAAEFKDTSKRFVWLLAVLLVLGLTGFFLARPVYKVIKTRRALGMVEATEANLKAGNWDEALRSVKVMLELAPTEPKIIRLAAQYCTQRSMGDGINYWQMLIGKPGATREDLLSYLELCLNFNRTDIVVPQLESLLRTSPNDPAFLRLYVRALQASAPPEVARLAARRWLNTEPGDEEAQLALGAMLSGSSREQERAEGRRLLWGLAVGQGQYHQEAVDALLPSPELTSAECKVLLNTIADRPGRQIAVLNLRLKLEPGRRAELADELARSAKAAGTPAALAQAASWFADHGEVDRVLDLLPEDKVGKDPVLLTARLQALLEKDRLAEVQPYLEMENPPVEPYLLHCLRALTAQKSGHPQVVLGHFQSALAACTNNPAKLQFVAGYAERVGEPRAAVAAYERMMVWPPLTFTAGREILRLLSPLDDTKSSREILRRLEQFMPGDESILLASTYFGFLLGEKLP